MRHLRILLKIKWQDRITNAEVLERSQSTSIADRGAIEIGRARVVHGGRMNTETASLL